MLISLNWIKQLTDLKLEKKELLERIGSRLAEIESVTELGERYDGIIVGEITDAKEHPDADKLGVYKVNIGKAKVQVVAGDKTLEPGDRVGYIAPGRVVPSTADDPKPVEINKAKLRGVDSNGMLGSGKELGLNADASGVLKLDHHLKPGTKLAEAYELDDTIIEIENKALTHRPDCFGLIGIAREIAGIQGVQFKTPSWYLKATELVKLEHEQLPINIKNQIPDLVPRYMALSMSAVKVKPSPMLMQSYLMRLGVKPISNVVDITNYLMVLTGQPLHAFDYDKVVAGESHDSAQITVRFPKKNETINLLDGRTIKIHPKAIVIANRTRPIALGGVMGASDSEVDESTQRIILESANFNLYSIRETSMKHGIFTDAVTRFARGQDPNQCEPVLHRAAIQISELSDGMLASQVHDNFQGETKRYPITVSVDEVNQKLGSEYLAGEMVHTLKAVELDVHHEAGRLIVTPPTWRQDLHISEDIIEEIGRLLGYDHLKVVLPTRDLTPAFLSKDQQLKRRIRSLLAAAGANEVLTYNFISDELINHSGQEKKFAYHIRNSISPELAYMRTSIMPSLFDKIYGNIRAGYDHFALFEINKSHNKQELDKDNLPIERHTVAFVIAARTKFADKELTGAAYYQARRTLDYMLNELGVHTASFSEISEKSPLFVRNIGDSLHKDRRAVVSVGKTVLGVIGEPSAKVAQNFKLDYAAGFEVDIDALLSVLPEKTQYKPLSRFPAIDQDVTLRTPLKVSFEKVNAKLALELDHQHLIVSITPVGVYQGEFEKVSRNITWHLKIQHRERTLKTQEVNDLISEAVKALNRSLGTKQI